MILTNKAIVSLKVLTVSVFLVIAACSNANSAKKISANKYSDPFKLDFAISLYAASLESTTNSADFRLQHLDNVLISKRAKDYLKAWDKRDGVEIRARLERVFSPVGTYSDVGETAHGIDEVVKTILWMHNDLKGQIRTFRMAGEPEIIEHTESVYYNVKNLMVYNWDWLQEGQSVLYGKEMTLFDDDNMIYFDMGTFSPETFPTFPDIPEVFLQTMNDTVNAYLAKLNGLNGKEKYRLIESALTDPSSEKHGDHSARLSWLKEKDLSKAEFIRSGKPAWTRITIVYPWQLRLGNEVLLEGTEVNVFDESWGVKYAFGFSGK